MRIIVTALSNPALVKMVAASIRRTKNHHRFVNPDLVDLS